MQEFEEEELRRHYLGSSSPPPEEAPTPEPSSPPPAEDLAIEALIEDVDDIVEQAKRAAGGTDQDRKRLFRMVRSCGKKLAVFEDLDDDSKVWTPFLRRRMEVDTICFFLDYRRWIFRCSGEYFGGDNHEEGCEFVGTASN
jgi:hypothetical protein